MRLFTLKPTVPQVNLLVSKASDENQLVFLATRTADNYSAMQKAALARERRSINIL